MISTGAPQDRRPRYTDSMKSSLKTAVLVLTCLLGLTVGGASANAGGKCKTKKNLAVAKTAVTQQLADSKSAVAAAYAQFLTKHQEGIESRYATVDAGKYKEPVKQKWLTVVPIGQARGTTGPDKESAVETCDDVYLAVIAIPLDWKWHRALELFEVVVRVSSDKSVTIVSHDGAEPRPLYSSAPSAPAP